MQQTVNIVKEIIYEAAQNIRTEINQELVIENKDTKDWVTNIDKETEKFLVNKLTEAFPHSGFLTEEDTVDYKKAEALWIIDPIDGTSNMIYQKDHFAISVAHYINEKAAFGIVYNVMSDEMYVGIRGEGAYLNDIKLEKLDPSIDLSNKILLGNIFRKDMFSVDTEVISSVIPAFRHLGSGAIDSCRVADAKASAYVFPKISVWDIAASTIILKEVGGTWQFGDQVDSIHFNSGSYRFMAASNKEVLQTLQSWL